MESVVFVDGLALQNHAARSPAIRRSRPPLPSTSAPASRTVPIDYQQAWNEASKLSQSRRFGQLSPEPEVVVRRTRSTGNRRMKIDLGSSADGASDGRKRSNEGLGSWIDKYNKSDHHTDRLVRTIVHYEETTGQRFPDAKLIPPGYANMRSKNLVSDLPDVVYVKTGSINDKPVVFDTTAPTVRRPSIDRGTFLVNQASSYRRPPISPRIQPDTILLSRATSLPPSPDPYIRRASVSGPSASYRSFQSPVVSRPLATQTASVVGRRASYAGLPTSTTPSYVRTYSFGSAAPQVNSYGSRHTTPDRSFDAESASRSARAPSVGLTAARRPSVSGSWAGSVRSRSLSVDRTSPVSSTLPPSAPMSDARRKIRLVLNKTSGSEE